MCWADHRTEFKELWPPLSHSGVAQRYVCMPVCATEALVQDWAVPTSTPGSILWPACNPHVSLVNVTTCYKELFPPTSSLYRNRSCHINFSRGKAERLMAFLIHLERIQSCRQVRTVTHLKNIEKEHIFIIYSICPNQQLVRLAWVIAGEKKKKFEWASERVGYVLLKKYIFKNFSIWTFVAFVCGIL